MSSFYSFVALIFLAQVSFGLKVNNNTGIKKKIKAASDETLEIPCIFEIDKPNYWIKWFKDGNDNFINRSEKYDYDIKTNINMTSIMSNLTIRETSINDTGNYSCILTNDPNNKTMRSGIKLFPVIVSELQKEIAINFGESLLIPCFFDIEKLKLENKKVLNDSRIVWLQNSTDNLIRTNRKLKISIKSYNNGSFLISELLIDDAFEKDSDLYLCMLLSHLNDSLLNTNFTREDAKNYTIDAKKFPVSVTDEKMVHNLLVDNTDDEYREVEAKIYNSLTILPVLTNSFLEEVGSRVKKVEFHWFKDQQTYLPYSEHTEIFKASYSLVNKLDCTQYDAGVYTVLAETDIFTKNLTFRVFIKSKPIMKMLYAQPENPKDIKGVWVAECEVYAYPEGQMYWTFRPCYNLKLNSEPNCQEEKIISPANNISTLPSINNGDIKAAEIRFQPYASGFLECKGINSLGKRTALGNIIIESLNNPINVSFVPNNQEIYVGNRIELICESIVFFDSLKWYSVDHAMVVDPNKDKWMDVQVSDGDTDIVKKTVLLFKYIKESNQGNYECRGYKNFNYTSFESKAFHLNVKKSLAYLWYILLIIPILLLLAAILYWYYRKITAAQPWMLLYDERFEFPVERIKIEKELGCGAFGVVFEAVAEGILPTEPETTVAVKTIKKSTLNESTLRSLESELEIMLSLGKHLNIVNLLGAITKNPLRYKLMVIVEFCPYGNIKNYLFENRNSFVNQIDPVTGVIDKEINSRTFEDEYNPSEITTSTLILWAFQIARGMDYVSSQKVLHGDLAARNILLTNNNVVKICDFGLAKSMNYQYNYQSKGNAPLPMRWLAIETLESGVFSTYSDIWSYGVVLWELFSLCKEPYEKMHADRLELLDKLEGGFRMLKPKFANNEIYQIMLDCWIQDPESRPVFSDLENRFKNLLDDNISTLYVKMNEPYEAENQQNLAGIEKAKMESAKDGLVPEKMVTTDCTDNKPMIRELSFNKLLEYTNQKMNENPERNVTPKAFSNKEIIPEIHSQTKDSIANCVSETPTLGKSVENNVEKQIAPELFKKREEKIFASEKQSAPLKNSLDECIIEKTALGKSMEQNLNNLDIEKLCVSNPGYKSMDFSDRSNLTQLGYQQMSFTESPSISRNNTPICSLSRTLPKRPVELPSEGILIDINSEPLDESQSYENMNFKTVNPKPGVRNFVFQDSAEIESNDNQKLSFQRDGNDVVKGYMIMKPLVKARNLNK